jgi:hypothetical protein
MNRANLSIFYHDLTKFLPEIEPGRRIKWPNSQVHKMLYKKQFLPILLCVLLWAPFVFDWFFLFNLTQIT